MSTVFTGPKASLKLNGQKVAYVGGLRISQENTLADVDVLDQLETAEFAEVGHKVHFSCDLFKTDANSLQALGLDFTSLDALLTQPELSLDVYDRIEDKIQYSIQGVKWESGSGSIDARGVWRGEWSFRGRIGGAAAGGGSL